MERKPTCQVIYPGETYHGKQNLDYQASAPEHGRRGLACTW
jgi:uncharacterized RmlC-like cupin family protein